MRVAVVGVGHLGKHHARILGSMPGVELVAVVDTNQARAQEIAAANNTQALTDVSGLIGTVDAVSIAVPTERHLEIALPFLKAGVPVLVEKPMARSLEEADLMIAAAAASGVALAVGQTERFNPAVEAARPMLRDPRFIEVHRLGTFPERSLDIDVVFDLMIHDLDVVASLVDSEVESVEAVGVPVLTGRVDIHRLEHPCQPHRSPPGTPRPPLPTPGVGELAVQVAPVPAEGARTLPRLATLPRPLRRPSRRWSCT